MKATEADEVEDDARMQTKWSHVHLGPALFRNRTLCTWPVPITERNNRCQTTSSNRVHEHAPADNSPDRQVCEKNADKASDLPKLRSRYTCLESSAKRGTPYGDERSRFGNS